MGVGMGLREKNPNIKIIEAQPTKVHSIQELKAMEEAIIPAIYDESKIDKLVAIVSEEALLLRNEFGAAMLTILRTIPEIPDGYVVVVFLPGRGEKFLSTNLFDAI